MDEGSTIELLTRLRQLNVELSAKDGKLKINAPKGVLSQALIEELSRRKSEIIRILNEAKNLSVVDTGIDKAAGLQLPAIKPISRSQQLPLSFSQERLWFLQKMEPDSCAYNMPGNIRFNGRLDQDALKNAFIQLAERHESLRTTFAFNDGLPEQLIGDASCVHFEVMDLRKYPQEKRQKEAYRMSEDWARIPFDLATGPLLRLFLYQLDEYDHILHVNMHHIISDYWSFSVMNRELAELYRAYATNSEPQLPELPVQYADFAYCQRRWLQGSAFDTLMAYWQKKLGGELATLDLPTDCYRPAIQTHRGADQSLILEMNIVNALRKFSHEEGVSLFMVFLAAFKVLLHRYTGQTDIIVGTPISGRSRVELEGLIGFFLNTIVMRTDLSGSPSFQELLGRVRETALGAYAHQEMPFEKLVEVFAPDRDMSRTPLFQVFFNYIRINQTKIELPEVNATITASEEHDAKFDLTLYASENDNTVHLRFLFNADLFDAGRMEAMLSNYRTLLSSIVEDPSRKLSELDLLTPEQRQQNYRRRNSVSPNNAFAVFSGEDIEQSIPNRFKNTVEKYRHKTAVKTVNHEWSYNHLNKTANRMAHTLLDRNRKRSRRVALMFEQDVQMVAGVFGVLKAGMTYVPLDPTYPAERLAYMVTDSQVDAILTNNSNVELAKSLLNGNVELINADNDSGMSKNSEDPEIIIDPDTQAYILYTSGSTGRPKGVMQNHRNVLHFARVYTNALHISAEDRLTLISSYSFDAAVMDIYGALLNGATLYPVNIKEEGLATMPAWFNEHKVSIYHSTPTVYRALIDALPNNFVLSHTRLIVLGGEAVFKRDVENYKRHFGPECLFVNGLGPTESTMAMQYFLDHRSGEKKLRIPVGYSVAETDILLLNSEGSPDDVYGEIGIQSAYVALGYWKRPNETQNAFLPDPEGGNRRIYRTGDLGRRLLDGSMEYLGRKDFQVKIRGYRIETAEIENNLIEHPEIKNAAVIAKSVNDDLRLVACVVTHKAKTLEPLNLRRYLQAKLPDYMVPAYYVLLDMLPLTPTRKVDRKALEQMELELEDERQDQFVPARSTTEHALANIWSDVLGGPQISVDANFFELGGHSLLATQIISRIRKSMGAEVPFRSFFENPTIAGLAECIDRLTDGSGAVRLPQIEIVNRNQGLPLSFNQERLWFLHQLDPQSTAYSMPGSIRLRGKLDKEALAFAFTEVCRRHETLRTTFHYFDGTAVQIIASEPSVALEFHDLRHLSIDQPERAALESAEMQARIPFDLTKGPLFRGSLFQLDDDDYLLHVNMHHIISDYWSFGILNRELAQFYKARLAGAEANLPDLPVQYADFGFCQRKWLQGDVLDTFLNYWMTKLGGELMTLDLPTDRPRPAIQTYQGEDQTITLEKTLVDALKSISQQEGVSLFMLFLSAFKLLVSRFSGQSDVIVGSPVAGRNRMELEGLIGFFINTIVMRTDLSGLPTFRELLQRVRETVLGAYTHQEMPFEKLVQVMAPDRDVSRTPLFQVFFNYIQVEQMEVDLPDVKVEFEGAIERESKFDLTLYLWEQKNSIRMNALYNKVLFDAVRIETLLYQYEMLLSQIVADPDKRICSYSLVLQKNGAGPPDPTIPIEPCWRDSVHNAQVRQSQRFPSNVAIVDQYGNWQYRSLEQASNKICNQLLACGINPGDIVAVFANRSAGLVLSIIGVLKAGAAFTILPSNYPSSRLVQMIKAVGPSALITLEAAGPVDETLNEVVEGLNLKVRMSISKTFEGLDNQLRDVSPELPEIKISGDDIAYILFTSGTTGVPKGIVTTHASLSHFIDWHCKEFKFDQADRFSMLSGLGHDPLMRDIFTPLSVGATLCIPSAAKLFNPKEFRLFMKEQKITVAHMTPALGQLLAGSPDADDESEREFTKGTSDLRYVFIGGDDLTWQLTKQMRRIFPNVKCVNFYGTTETPQAISFFRIDSDSNLNNLNNGWTVPLGQGIEGVQLLIINQDGQLAGVGEVGEICVRTPYLAKGYLNEDELTRKLFITNPFAKDNNDRIYKTGDLGRYLPGGDVKYHGRSDDQISIRGFRVEPKEIEAILADHPKIRQCVVIAKEGEFIGTYLIAYVVYKNGDSIASSKIKSYLKQYLPDYAIPARVFGLGEIPLSTNGKIDREKLLQIENVLLKKQNLDKHREIENVPLTEMENIIIDVWKEVLQHDDIRVHDNFFELGGHSLLTIQVVEVIERKTGLRMNPREFINQSVGQLALSLENQLKEKGRSGKIYPKRGFFRNIKNKILRLGQSG